MSGLSEGLLIRVEPRTWTVEVGEREIPCSLKPSLFQGNRKTRSPVAVGDRVHVRLEGERGVIEEVLPRKNVLARPAPTKREELQVTAANVDVLVIVVATKDPPPRRGLIDRFLVAAERNGMDPVLVLNKIDADAADEARQALSIYPRIGYPVLEVSALHPELHQGIDRLRQALAHKTALFVGHSGVGKSSLLNALVPDLTLRTGNLAKHGRGRHTTTSVALFRIPGGGHGIDSPGIRGFGLFEIPKGELAVLMPDLRPHATGCKYPDCSHDHEPHCAVRAAVQRGDVDRERYESYLRMVRGERGEEG